MDTSEHSMRALFDQLGLPSSEAEIVRFIESHRAQIGAEPLQDAKFWTHNQAVFLGQALGQDSDWAPVVDELNNLLHS